MAYTKQTWTDGSGGGTPLSAARLSAIEDGIEGAHNTADTHASRHSDGGSDEINVVDLGSGSATANAVLISDGSGGLEFSSYVGGSVHHVAHNGTNWRYNGATVTARPSIPSYPDALVHFDSSQQISVTAPPSWEENGDRWDPHPDAAI